MCIKITNKIDLFFTIFWLERSLFFRGLSRRTRTIGVTIGELSELQRHGFYIWVKNRVVTPYTM